MRIISEKVDISVWKTNFFPTQAIAKILFVLHFRHTWDTPYQVCFNCIKFLTMRKRPIFKIRYSRNSQISVWKTNFFPTQAIAKILFVLHFRHTWDTPYQVCFNCIKFLTMRKRPIFKIRYSRNSQISVRKTNFFLTQAIAKILFVLHFRHTWDTPYRVWFDLDNSLTQWNFYIFENRIRE